MIRLNDMAKRLGVSVKTLQRWDREGILVAKRNPNNRRYYTEDQYLEYIGSSKKKGRKLLLMQEYQVTIKKMTYKTKSPLFEIM